MYLDYDVCTDEYYALRAEGMTTDDALAKVTDMIQRELDDARENSGLEDDLISLRSWWMDLDMDELEE